MKISIKGMEGMSQLQFQIKFDREQKQNSKKLTKAYFSHSEKLCNLIGENFRENWKIFGRV
jgi:hypothetical protein